MTQYFQLRVREGTFRHLTSEEVRAKAQSLLAINFVTIDIDYDGQEPDKPLVEIRHEEKLVYRYVCTVKGCSREFDSKVALAGHLRHHKLRVEVPVIR